MMHKALVTGLLMISVGMPAVAGANGISPAFKCPAPAISDQVVANVVRGDISALNAMLDPKRTPPLGLDFANCPNARGHLPLIQAIIHNRRGALQWLLDHGAHPDFVGPRSREALITAAAFERYYHVRALLEAGAWVDVRDRRGMTALHHAALAGNTRMVKLLIDHNAQLDFISRKMRTPLIDAVALGHIEIVRTLLDAGATTIRSDLWGNTAFDVAREFNLTDISTLLEQYGWQ